LLRVTLFVPLLLLLSSAPQDGTEKSRQIFITVPTEVGQTEAEEIGELECSVAVERRLSVGG
jgi:hypothetical protein